MFVVPESEYVESDYSSVFKWGVAKLEVSEEGFRHYQCVGVTDNNYRESAIKGKLPKAQTIEAKSLKNALDYVLKDDTAEDVPKMFGDVPKQYQNKIEGKVFGPNSAIKAAASKRTYQEAIDTFASMCPWEYVKNKKAVNTHFFCIVHARGYYTTSDLFQWTRNFVQRPATKCIISRGIWNRQNSVRFVTIQEPTHSHL